MWRARRAEAQLIIAVAAAVLLAAAQLDDWHGDPTWGPRRALPLVPLAVEAVALAWAGRRSQPDSLGRRASLWIAIAAAAGLGVQVVGVAIAPSTYYDVVTEVRLASGSPSWFGEQPSECHFMPQFSPILGHAWLLSHLLRNDRRFDVDPPYKLLLATPPRLDGIWPRLRVDWFAVGWPRAVAAAWLAALAALAVAAALVLRRRVLR
jgi:hypothetical protein